MWRRRNPPFSRACMCRRIDDHRSTGMLLIRASCLISSYLGSTVRPASSIRLDPWSSHHRIAHCSLSRQPIWHYPCHALSLGGSHRRTWHHLGKSPSQNHAICQGHSYLCIGVHLETRRYLDHVQGHGKSCRRIGFPPASRFSPGHAASFGRRSHHKCFHTAIFGDRAHDAYRWAIDP